MQAPSGPQLCKRNKTQPVVGLPWGLLLTHQGWQYHSMPTSLVTSAVSAHEQEGSLVERAVWKGTGWEEGLLLAQVNHILIHGGPGVQPSRAEGNFCLWALPLGRVPLPQAHFPSGPWDTWPHRLFTALPRLRN